MNCFVTGGLGFLGSYISMELVRLGHNVTIFDIETCIPSHIQGCQIVNGDIRNYQELKKNLIGKNIIFHFSGILGTSELFENPHEAIDVNIKGTLNLILACQDLGIKRILIPNKPNEWHNLYSFTSQAIAKMALAYNEFENFDIRILKTWNVYGPFQKTNPVRKAIPTFILQALENKPLEIFGDGMQPIELIYVKDFCEITVKFALSDLKISNNVYEIISKSRMNVLNFARHIIALTNSKSTITFLPMRIGENIGVTFERDLDVFSIIDRHEETKISLGLSETIEYYRGLPEKIKFEALNFYEAEFT